MHSCYYIVYYKPLYIIILSLALLIVHCLYSLFSYKIFKISRLQFSLFSENTQYFTFSPPYPFIFLFRLRIFALCFCKRLN